jgi:6-pyruvoyltetrahydropterin/6-carboxytetrahydropterin synthase
MSLLNRDQILKDAVFSTENLDQNNIIIDIGFATTLLKEILHKYNFKNLDEFEEFKGKNTTTEVLRF